MTDHQITALHTLQFLRDAKTVHLVRQKHDGTTPGPTLCGIDRFAPLGPGWALTGVSEPDDIRTPCPGCTETARREFPGLPVSGRTGGREMAAELGVEMARGG